MKIQFLFDVPRKNVKQLPLILKKSLILPCFEKINAIFFQNKCHIAMFLVPYFGKISAIF
jgi:hypothetical protein